ncbi:hypothetical protein FRB94_000960 [Tulasnella sp. JGI-2019a]|nr:hypothetical protein FRB94_000960 [Tulasnella sp. JGI-2019a]KAG9018339.1 hypothetical protein FRB93_000042 [Tulasnella sp. JGI-2019a]KAG9029323.1 hypothetical protein FRB95_005487 [Tulasnella sp. JGI-2019a]
MKLDATDIRYISSDEFRVLTATEMGSKNHEVVPTPLIAQISGLRNGGVNKILGVLARRNLVARVQNASYDGYRLTYGGYDFLALRALSKRDAVYSVGNQIGVGKESDIYVVADNDGKEMVMKMHRLGRISFRAIKSKRDYMGKRKSASWMYMSRLAAQKEWAFMKVLHEHGFPVPKPIDQARHCIIMEFIDSYPLRQISSVPSPGKLYSELMDLIVRFAQAGLIHGDFNEFNILIHRLTSKPIVIDFPQMVSTRHANAEYYFNRDVECIRTFFRRRFAYESNLYPRFSTTVDVKEGEEDVKEGGEFRLDVVVAASGFKNQDLKALEEYMVIAREQKEGSDVGGGSDDDGEGETSRASTVGDDEELEDYSDHSSRSSDAEDGDETDDAQHRRNQQSRSLAPSPTSSAASELAKAVEKLGIAASLPPPTDVMHVVDDEGEGEGDVTMALTSPPVAPPSQTGLDVTEEDSAVPAHAPTIVRDIVAGDLVKQQRRQQAKYHAKKGGAGRSKGSKMKQDTRVDLGKGGYWE